MILGYLFSFPSQVMKGDYFAIMVSLILGYVSLIVLHHMSRLFLIVIKKTIAFIVTGLALLMIYTKFMEHLGAEGFTVKTYLIGVTGFIIGLAGTFISFYALFRQTKKAISKMGQEKIQPEPVMEGPHTDTVDLQSVTQQPHTAKVQLAPSDEPWIEKTEPSPITQKPHTDINQIKEFKTFFSMDSLKNDKSLLSVLTFLIVAEFGVFSSKTISAPNPKIGMIIFGIFMFFSLIFIKQSYSSYARGLFHVVITFCIGGTLALVLGHFWQNIPLSVLLSLEVFETDALVALISGMALSLFAGSRK